jgi:hypothetical protein
LKDTAWYLSSSALESELQRSAAVLLYSIAGLKSLSEGVAYLLCKFPKWPGNFEEQLVR